MLLSEWINSTTVTKREVAVALNINESTLYNYVNRERMPRLDLAAKIVLFTGGKVGIADLIIEPFNVEMEPYEVPLEDML